MRRRYSGSPRVFSIVRRSLIRLGCPGPAMVRSHLGAPAGRTAGSLTCRRAHALDAACSFVPFPVTPRSVLHVAIWSLRVPATVVHRFLWCMRLTRVRAPAHIISRGRILLAPESHPRRLNTHPNRKPAKTHRSHARFPDSAAPGFGVKPADSESGPHTLHRAPAGRGETSALANALNPLRTQWAFGLSNEGSFHWAQQVQGCAQTASRPPSCHAAPPGRMDGCGNGECVVWVRSLRRAPPGVPSRCVCEGVWL